MHCVPGGSLPRFKAQLMPQALAQTVSSSRPVAFPVSSSNYAGENHQWKNKRFTFYRDLVAHSRDLDLFHCPARSQGLNYTNCWAGHWGTAGLQQECRGCHSIWAGDVATGRCGCNVTEEAASPSPPLRNVMLLHLNHGQPGSRGTQQLRLDEPAPQLWKERLPRRKKQPFCLSRALSTQPWHPGLPNCSCGAKTED